MHSLREKIASALPDILIKRIASVLFTFVLVSLRVSRAKRHTYCIPLDIALLALDSYRCILLQGRLIFFRASLCPPEYNLTRTKIMGDSTV